jgi:hypothetical protein
VQLSLYEFSKYEICVREARNIFDGQSRHQIYKDKKMNSSTG